MTQTIRQRSHLHAVPKVQIGARYDGPPLDRACLRQLPRGWNLSVEEESKQPLSSDHWVIIACIIAALVGIVQTLLQML